MSEKDTRNEEKNANERSGSNPHAEFEQSKPFVNKEEPAAFANPVESGAKMPSEDVYDKPNPRRKDYIQEGSSESCAGDVHHRQGSDPHAEYEQSRPFVNKDEQEGAANPCESGAKKPSKDVDGKPMPDSGTWS